MTLEERKLILYQLGSMCRELHGIAHLENAGLQIDEKDIALREEVLIALSSIGYTVMHMTDEDTGEVCVRITR